MKLSERIKLSKHWKKLYMLVMTHTKQQKATLSINCNIKLRNLTSHSPTTSLQTKKMFTFMKCECYVICSRPIQQINKG